jgi:hypothetical protein
MESFSHKSWKWEKQQQLGAMMPATDGGGSKWTKHPVCWNRRSSKWTKWTL